MARYDRETLYEKVWTQTMKQVALGYGVSDVAIGKTCRKLHVPVPGRGYWAKKVANRPVERRPPLPVIQTRSQLSEGNLQQAIAGSIPAGLPQTARSEWLRNEDPECNRQTLANRQVTSEARKPRTITAFEEFPQVSTVLLARYDRKSLYEKVWTMPVQLAAKEYGVSNVAIAKTCRKLHIPVPGRGYWAKKAANRPVEPRPPLPQLLTET